MRYAATVIASSVISLSVATGIPAAHAAGATNAAGGESRGFLAPTNLVDSLALLPPPPEAGSPDAATDRAAQQASAPLRDTPRWRMAIRDAEFKYPRAVDAFACAAGVAINGKTTPHLERLLFRVLADASAATQKAKAAYARKRPFVMAGTSTCQPEFEDELRNNGSYPSGHASFGWAWALVLSEVQPTRTDALMQRGYAFGQSRVICGYHWQSDVNAGRLVGAAVVAQLHANPVFMSELVLAQQEVAAARLSGAAKPDCSLDQAMLQ